MLASPGRSAQQQARRLAAVLSSYQRKPRQQTRGCGAGSRSRPRVRAHCCCAPRLPQPLPGGATNQGRSRICWAMLLVRTPTLASLSPSSCMSTRRHHRRSCGTPPGTLACRRPTACCMHRWSACTGGAVIRWDLTHRSKHWVYTLVWNDSDLARSMAIRRWPRWAYLTRCTYIRALPGHPFPTTRGLPLYLCLFFRL